MVGPEGPKHAKGVKRRRRGNRKGKSDLVINQQAVTFGPARNERARPAQSSVPRGLKNGKQL